MTANLAANIAANDARAAAGGAVMDSPIIVITDHIPNAEGGYDLTGPSMQLLTLARSLTSGVVHAIALNPRPDVANLGAYGADSVLSTNLGELSPRVPAVVADAAYSCLQAYPGSALLCVSNYRGREVAAQLAIRTGSGAAVDVTQVEIVDGNLVASKSVFSGSWQTSFTPNRGVPIIAVRPSATAAATVEPARAAQVTVVDVDFRPETAAIKVRSSRRHETDGRVSLNEAQVVVCGGRGTGGDFSVIEQLADELGGAVGATRVCADEGWVDHAIQIGQTGVTIAPRLYIGAGVSGAIHHTCGMQQSENIIAVCDDPDAPIFELADLGVVADLFEVLPAVIAKLREQ